MSDDTQAVIILADAKAKTLNAPVVGTEHLLLASITIPSQASTIMLHLGFDQEQVEAEIAEMEPERVRPLPEGPRADRFPPLAEQLPLQSPRFSISSDTAFTLARKEATQQKAAEVEVAHLVVALMSVRGCNAARLLGRRRATVKGLRRNLYPS